MKIGSTVWYSLLLMVEIRGRFLLQKTTYRLLCSHISENIHKRSSVKTVHRTVFLTLGFKSPYYPIIIKNPSQNVMVFYGGDKGI